MNEINIAAVLGQKRRERGLTQEEVAAHLGVTKASVSKWECGQSYPDITLLPLLAAYFNVTIDDLVDYHPQLDRAGIRRLYGQLADEASRRPFEEVLDKARTAVQAYYGCYPLLAQMAVFYLNHYMLAPTAELGQIMQEEALALCQRVRTECTDLSVLAEARAAEALLWQLGGHPEQVVALYGEDARVLSPAASLLAQSYQQLGEQDKAREIAQVDLYQHLLFVLEDSALLATLSPDAVLLAEIMARAQAVVDAYHIPRLQPNSVLVLYYTAAVAYCGLGQPEQALAYLNKYVEIAVGHFFPYSLHGDGFFDALDPWLAELAGGSQAPRSEATIKEGIIQALDHQPAFDPLREDERFGELLQRLRFHLDK